MHKNLLPFVVIFLFGQMVLANVIPVQIKPEQKITTSNAKLQEGDSINFVIMNDVYLNSKIYIKSGEPVAGTITNLKSNNFLYEPASVYLENFVTKNTDGKKVKLEGVIYKKGNDYSMITQFIPFPMFTLKGGEAKFRPNKDTFTLYLEEKDD